MKKLIGAVVLCALVGGAQAQEMKVDLSKLPPEVSAKILESQQPTVSVSRAKEWADVGENLARAVGATARVLSIEANEFVKTPVGWWAFAFIFWYFLGAKIWSIVGGLLMWCVLGSMIWRSFSIFHRPRQVLVSRENGVEKWAEKSYDFCSGDAKMGSALLHLVVFAILSVASMVIVFGK